MLGKALDFFRTGPDQPRLDLPPDELRRRYERMRWSVFLSVTFGYGCFYVCRINFAVAKKSMLDAGVLTATEMGVIGSALLFVYAFGKFVNGFLADHANIRRFMSAALLTSALVNLVIGFKATFWLFAALWAINGWAQSVGSAPSVVALSHWFSRSERGTRYGVWSASHSIGEAITFATTALLVAAFGWSWGFWGPAIIGIAVALTLSRTLADRPLAYGLPSVSDYKQEAPEPPKPSVWSAQREVLTNPAIWLLALASASMYVTRYGLDHWAVLFLEEGKGYTLTEAGRLFAICPIFGLCGSVSSGFVSDKLFGSRRQLPTVLYALVELTGLVLFFLVPPGHRWLDTAAVAVYGFGLGGMLVFLGGLIAVDIAPRGAAGAAMGLVGVMSYLGASVQDVVSGALIELGRKGEAARAYDAVFLFWIAASVVALALATGLLMVRRRDAAPDSPPPAPPPSPARPALG